MVYFSNFFSFIYEHTTVISDFRTCGLFALLPTLSKKFNSQLMNIYREFVIKMQMPQLCGFRNDLFGTYSVLLFSI